MAFDIKLNNLAEKAEIGYKFEVKLPDGSSTGFYITVRGNQSPKIKQFSKELFTKTQIKDQVAKRKGKTDQIIDLDEVEQTLVESAVARVITWEGLEDGGKVVEPTPDNILHLMKEQDWIRKQVLDESDNDASFI